MADQNSGAEILRALNMLEQGILRARRLTGLRGACSSEPAALPGGQRAAVAELLDALHNLPEYLRELLGHAPEGLPPFVIERAFELFDDLIHQPLES